MELEYRKTPLVLFMRQSVADRYNDVLGTLSIPHRLKESKSVRLQGDMRAYETVYRRPTQEGGA